MPALAEDQPFQYAMSGRPISVFAVLLSSAEVPVTIHETTAFFAGACQRSALLSEALEP